MMPTRNEALGTLRAAILARNDPRLAGLLALTQWECKHTGAVWKVTGEFIAVCSLCGIEWEAGPFGRLVAPTGYALRTDWPADPGAIAGPMLVWAARNPETWKLAEKIECCCDFDDPDIAALDAVTDWVKGLPKETPDASA